MKGGSRNVERTMLRRSSQVATFTHASKSCTAFLTVKVLLPVSAFVDNLEGAGSWGCRKQLLWWVTLVSRHFRVPTRELKGLFSDVDPCKHQCSNRRWKLRRFTFVFQQCLMYQVWYRVQWIFIWWVLCYFNGFVEASRVFCVVSQIGLVLWWVLWCMKLFVEGSWVSYYVL